MPERSSPETGWRARIRRWPWLDRSAVRTDQSEANRGFYSGGPPVYVRRKPVGWRFALVMLALGSILAGVILVVRDAEAQAPDDGQRLIFEEAGFAVTVPSEWEVRTYEPPWEEGDAWAVAFSDTGESAQICSFDTWYQGPGSPLMRVYPEHDPTLAWLDLPEGRARQYVASGEGYPHNLTAYSFERGAARYDITCYGPEAPEDRWLSIASTFGFLRHDPQVVAVRPGVTMTFPIEWRVLEDRGQMAGAPGWEKVLWATDGAAVCRIANDTRAEDAGLARTSEELRAEYLDYLRSSATGPVEPEDVVLPVGAAWRADWSAGPEARTLDHSLYQLPVDATSLRLACFASDAPRDRWLSLAETIVTR